ncbi:hypothetical protein BGZ72_002600, partial [Mortierella alpina]
MGITGLPPIIKKGTGVVLNGSDKICLVDLLGLYFSLIRARGFTIFLKQIKKASSREPGKRQRVE